MNTKEDGRVKVPFFLDYTFVWRKSSVQDRWPSDHMFFRRKQRPHGAFRTIWTSICTIETLQAAAAGLLGLLSGRLDTKIHLHILQWLQWSFIPSSLTWSLWPGAEETNKTASEKWNINKLRQRRFFEICIYLFQTSRGQRQSFWQQSVSILDETCFRLPIEVRKRRQKAMIDFVLIKQYDSQWRKPLDDSRG